MQTFLDWRANPNLSYGDNSGSEMLGHLTLNATELKVLFSYGYTSFDMQTILKPIFSDHLPIVGLWFGRVTT
jgi:hypothetical protein